MRSLTLTPRKAEGAPSRSFPLYLPADTHLLYGWSKRFSQYLTYVRFGDVGEELQPRWSSAVRRGGHMLGP